MAKKSKFRYLVTIPTPKNTVGTKTDVSFYTTREEIETGIGDRTEFNDATRAILADMDKFCVTGISREQNGFDIQIQRFLVEPPYKA
jgi:hypothetical protein